MCPSACISVTYFSSVIEIPQVCRNINRVKICMETGRTVILLNLENLYESLYDALNQVSLVKLTSGEYCWLRLVDTQLLWQCYHDATHGQLEDKRKKAGCDLCCARIEAEISTLSVVEFRREKSLVKFRKNLYSFWQNDSETRDLLNTEMCAITQN